MHLPLCDLTKIHLWMLRSPTYTSHAVLKDEAVGVLESCMSLVGGTRPPHRMHVVSLCELLTRDA